MRRYFYRGKHRKPNDTRRRAATVAVTGAVWITLTSESASAGPPGGWERIIQCESGGNPQAKNPSSTASGLFQFINGTWRAYGGTQFAPTAREATVEQQYIVAERAYADAGLTPWNASKSCWGNKISSGSPAPKAEPRRSGPQPTGRAADGSGTYVCDEAHLHFEACDPHNLGEVLNYPLYDKITAPAKPQTPVPAPAPKVQGDTYTVRPGDTLARIAAAFGVKGGWQALYERNRSVIRNPHTIFPGQQLTVR